MRDKYSTFNYWATNVNENNNLRGHVFMDKLPTESSVYVHALIFSNHNGIENVYSYFPTAKALLGYIQNAFLQKAFYKWVYGTKKLIMKIPALSTIDMIHKLEEENKVSKEEVKNMMKQYNYLNSLWNEDDSDIIRGLIKFSKDFNKVWVGDNTKFLYIKIFKNVEDLGEFVAESAEMTDKEEDFKERIGLSVNDWRNLCGEVNKNKEAANILRKILLNKLSEVL